MIKKWQIFNTNEDEVKELVNKYNINPLLATILVNRGFTQTESLDKFLKPTRNDFHNPFLMPDMKKLLIEYY